MKYRVTLNGKTYEIEVEQGEAQVLSVTDAAAAPVAAPASAPVAPAQAAPPSEC